MPTANKVWVLTEEYNAYDQYGEYFITVFMEKPTAEQLKGWVVPGRNLKKYDELLAHVVGGGGRYMPDGNYAAWDDHWYHLREVDAY